MSGYPTDQVKSIQARLAHLGFSPGNIDGVWGRLTQAQVRLFQASKNLVVDGIVGPKTYQALFGSNMSGTNSPKDTSLVWFQEARRLKGIREVPGSASNLVILNWASELGISYTGDDVPWCGLFIAHCIGVTLANEPLPKDPLMARSWRNLGASCTPGLGAVLVFWREDPNSYKGHVGLYAGESADGKSFLVLGGNQSDKVSYAWIAKSRLLEARWPATAPTKTTGTHIVESDGAFLSVNEA